MAIVNSESDSVTVPPNIEGPPFLVNDDSPNKDNERSQHSQIADSSGFTPDTSSSKTVACDEQLTPAAVVINTTHENGKSEIIAEIPAATNIYEAKSLQAEADGQDRSRQEAEAGDARLNEREEVAQGISDKPFASELATAETGAPRLGVTAKPQSEHSRRKGKRPRRAKVQEKVKEEEDVCFVCYDGGELVVCDRRTCPKSYHMDCIGRNPKFFHGASSWNCDWHYCELCKKAAAWQCCTCPRALCRSCYADGGQVWLRLQQRRTKAFCDNCLPLVKMLVTGTNVTDNGEVIDFDSEDTVESYFKEYWELVKDKLVPLPDFSDAGTAADSANSGLEHPKPHKKMRAGARKRPAAKVASSKPSLIDGKASGESPEVKELKPADDEETESDEDVMLEEDEDEDDDDDEEGEGADTREENAKRRMLQAREDAEEMGVPAVSGFEGWASIELLDFLGSQGHSRSKHISVSGISKILREYIREKNLQDPNKRSMILCDEAFQKLFGRAVVSQFHLNKLLAAHFSPNESKAYKSPPKGKAQQQHEDEEDYGDLGQGTKNPRARKGRRKAAQHASHDRPDPMEYAAISRKNMELIYLPRVLLWKLLLDPEFESKVVNTFVRIKVPGIAAQTELLYRLVQVTGVEELAEEYTLGKLKTRKVLCVNNRGQRDTWPLDAVSSQSFTDEECKNLRTLMKLNVVKKLTVGEVEQKAKEIQATKLIEWLEPEKQKLMNLRDRASERGAHKEQREAIEKLKAMERPEFLASKLGEQPQVEPDPSMAREDISDEEDDPAPKPSTTVQDARPSDFGTSHSWKGRNQVAVGRPGDSSWLSDASRKRMRLMDNRGLGKSEKADSPLHAPRAGAWGQARDAKPASGPIDRSGSSDWSSLGRRPQAEARLGSGSVEHGALASPGSSRSTVSWGSDAGLGSRTPGAGHPAAPSSRFSGAPEVANGATLQHVSSGSQRYGQHKTPEHAEASHPAPSLAGPVVPYPAPREMPLSLAAVQQEMWHYRDPHGVVQGPFPFEKLQGWAPHFPEELMVWTRARGEARAVRLKELLALPKVPPVPAMPPLPPALVPDGPHPAVRAPILRQATTLEKQPQYSGWGAASERIPPVNSSRRDTPMGEDSIEGSGRGWNDRLQPDREERQRGSWQHSDARVAEDRGRGSLGNRWGGNQDRICKFYQKGYCRQGASCAWKHV